MAQDITIAGASYADVPAVDVAKTGGGTARFVDTSDANATATDIATGKTAYVNGVKVTGTGTVMELQIIVSVNSGSTVTATKGALSVSGTSVNGSCTLIVPEFGTWSVTATLSGSGETSNTKAVNVGDSYSVALVSLTLNNNGWDVISEASNNGEGANYWAIGDRKAVTLDGTVGSTGLFNNVATYAFIIGFNHNSGYEGSGRIHFQLGKTALSGGTDVCFVDGEYGRGVPAGYFGMNSGGGYNTNSGGWASSQMRSLLGTSLSSYSGKLIGALPSALRSVLKSVTKYTDNTGNKSTSAANVTATTDYLFLLAEYEVFGSISIANTNESAKQAQYAYYSAGNSKIKYKHNNTATAASWWLRSPRASDSTDFVMVIGSGAVKNHDAYVSLGVAPGFCV